MAIATAQRRADARRRGDWKRSFRKYLPAYLFILPNFVGVLIFIAFPVLFALYTSFQDWDGVSAPRFIGLSNFQELFTDPVFWKTLQNTFAYTLLTVPVGIVFGLMVAILLQQKVRGLAAFRAAMFVPVVTSALAVSVIWKWIFDYDNGLINDALSTVNLPQIPWLTDATWAMIGIAMIGVWQGFGLTSVILMSALQSVPDSLLEAAEIDGAGAWRRFWNIRLPLIAPALLFVGITGFIGSFQVFAQVYYLTSGGPDYGTSVLNWLVFHRAFDENRFGLASALAYIMFAIIFAVTFLQFQLSRRATNAASEFDV